MADSIKASNENDCILYNFTKKPLICKHAFTDTKKDGLSPSFSDSRDRRTRTLDIWFWRPTFYQLNYIPTRF